MRSWTIALATALLVGLPADDADAGRRRRPPLSHEATGHLTFTSPQSSPIAVSPDGSLVFVTSATSHRVDVINTTSNVVIRTVDVGMEPVSIAFKPDGSEAWVSNHVSDSVSVIDTAQASGSFLRVVETLQDLGADGRTSFDEPVGIAFASNSKAYVALSSRDQIAVVDATTYSVTGRIQLTAQEPRAIAVQGGRLFVAAFESGNQSQASFCNALFPTGGVGDPCSLGLQELGQFVTNPNLPGEIKNIVQDGLPDRDLFVYRTDTDALLETVTGVGTLLYGLAVDGSQNVFVSQTDARNLANGDHGDLLVDLENRIFLNQIASLDCGGSNSNPCNAPTQHELEPALPSQPASTDALATPFGIALTSDDATLVVTAAATSRLFTASAANPSQVLDRLDVGAIPRGVALRDNGDGTHTAYVLNTLDNSVSVVSVTNSTGALSLVTTVPVGADPTPDAVRRGRIAFNDAFASDSATFACASCHPDGNTDQLLWRIGGECGALGCDPGDEPRSTMPVRGLRGSLPLHWDGTLGDAFGGPNGSTGSGGNLAANCSIPGSGDERACFRQLVDGSLSGVMCDQTGACPPGGNQLSEQEKDDMAAFLERVAYPPARSRPLDDVVSDAASPVTITDLSGGNGISANAVAGFEDFFMDQGGVGDPNTCADSNSGCHEFPLGASTNSETLQGFDAPTMRGMTDRFLQFSIGPTFTREILEQANLGLNLGGLNAGPLEAALAWSANDGPREITTFGAAFLAFEGVYNTRPMDSFQMFEEASTGTSGATGRQVMLSSTTTVGCVASDCGSCDTVGLLCELEEADEDGVVNLRGTGLRVGSTVTISYEPTSNALNPYKMGNLRVDRATVISNAQSGILLAPLTAHLRVNVSEDSPQPLIGPVGSNCNTGNGPTGNPALPTTSSFSLEAAHVGVGDEIFVDGAPTGIVLGSGDIADPGPAHPCGAGDLMPQRISISGISNTGATELLQVRSASSGLLSNEVPLP
jgi:YVTN family beta-propeller protein